MWSTCAEPQHGFTRGSQNPKIWIFCCKWVKISGIMFLIFWTCYVGGRSEDSVNVSTINLPQSWTCFLPHSWSLGWLLLDCPGCWGVWLPVLLVLGLLSLHMGCLESCRRLSRSGGSGRPGMKSLNYSFLNPEFFSRNCLLQEDFWKKNSHVVPLVRKSSSEFFYLKN